MHERGVALSWVLYRAGPNWSGAAALRLVHGAPAAAFLQRAPKIGQIGSLWLLAGLPIPCTSYPVYQQGHVHTVATYSSCALNMGQLLGCTPTSGGEGPPRPPPMQTRAS